MRLKEIKPGMVIHCKNYEEKKLLLQEAERLGYLWAGHKVPTDCYMMKNSGMTIHFKDTDEFCNFANITWSGSTDGVTEFSDLIIPELTAEELLDTINEICENNCCNDMCALSDENGCIIRKAVFDKKHVIEACIQWKSDHEKKEPEIETVDVCRIIEIQPDGRKRCVHEEDIESEFPFGGDERQKVEQVLKRYCMEHEGEFIAVHEVVSRVKAVE